MDSFGTGLGSLILGAFLAGAAGSFHCLGMCGPIAAVLGSQAERPWRQWAYQSGRITSYVLIAVLGAGLLEFFTAWSGVRVAAQLFRLLLALSLLLIGAYLLFDWRALERLSGVGAKVWQGLRPLASRWLPPKHAGHAFLLGMLWGWIPCGMVYAMLGVAWATNDVYWAAATMLAFGLGTTPMMLSAASGSGWLSARLNRQGLRRLSGALLILAAVLSLAQFSMSLAGKHQHGHAHTMNHEHH